MLAGCWFTSEMELLPTKPMLTMCGVHMHSDDESDCDEDFKFHFRVNILPYRALLLKQVLNALDELDVTIGEASEKILIQRNAIKRIERRRVGDIPSISRAPTSLPWDLYDSQWLEDHKALAFALRLAPAIGLRRLILN